MLNFKTKAEFIAAAQRLKTCTEWTAEDRLLLIAVLANVALQDMFRDGKEYGALGTPNMTAILHAIHETPETLNGPMSDITGIVDRLKP